MKRRARSLNRDQARLGGHRQEGDRKGLPQDAYIYIYIYIYIYVYIYIIHM